MFSATKVVDKLRGLVGFDQPFNPNYAILNVDNTTSRSGLKVNSHSMAKIEYLKDCQDYAEITDENFNLFLQKKQEKSILEVCNSVFSEATFIDRQILYKNPINKGIGTEDLPDGFIGHKICITDEKNTAFEIKRTILNFEGTGSIELLLFNSSKKQPLFSQVIEITSDYQEVDLNWRLDDTEVYKGEYYIGYLTNYADIGTLKPFKREYHDASVMSLIHSLYIEEGVFVSQNTNELQDLEDWDGSSITSGLNYDITVFKDYTSLIINNDFLFANAILKSFQITVLEEISNSIRSNRNTRLGEENLIRILQEIEGQEGSGVVKVSGLRPKLISQLQTLKAEIDKIKNGYFAKGLKVTTLK